ncbi:hypothetical protein D4764_08G0000470 [Takifugu flavidus]|uniref:Uncharacterized protein n=1 Tax=Takifugu flavidus TaxID=433684 RepID=A0A5C6MRI3_9TELE|nr:hypothetical protein D4764_08G0000470 [Takifugu flavidus]
MRDPHQLLLQLRKKNCYQRPVEDTEAQLSALVLMKRSDEDAAERGEGGGQVEDRIGRRGEERRGEERRGEERRGEERRGEETMTQWGDRGLSVTGTTELVTISFFKEVGFESDLKSSDGVSLPYLDRELVP